MTQGEAERRARLLEEAERVLDSRWDDAVSMVRDREHASRHSPRGNLGYADALLRRGRPEDVERAERAIRATLQAQERREQDAHYGNFRWWLEDSCVTDLNAVEFVLDGLNHLVRAHAGRLAPETLSAMRDAIALGLREIDRLDVHPSYTNIALSDICNSVLGGEAVGDSYYVERGARRLDEWWTFTNASGAPHEFNSPTYCAVDISRLATLAEHTRDRAIALKARMGEERLWLQVASHYHPALAQLAGPHSRSYYDGWTGTGGYLKLLLWRLLGDDDLRAESPYVPDTREEGHGGSATIDVRCPEYALDLMRQPRRCYETRETTDAAGGVDTYTYMTPEYALGTASKTYGVGEPLEIWPGFNSISLFFRRDGGARFGSLIARYLSDDAERARMGHDLWDEGVFVGAQHRNRAIVAYGLRPRMRNASSQRLSVRMLRVDAGSEVLVDGEPVREFPRRLRPEQRVVIAEGGVYVALVLLRQSDMGSDAPTELNVADGVLTLDVYNYLGPPKNFWEYRSLAGPFFRDNVRNGFVLEVAERSEFAGADEFDRHVAASTLADSLDGHAREITYASGDGTLSLRYDLRDMAPLGRRIDGREYASPMGCGGELDSGGVQWVQGRGQTLEAGDARLAAPGAPAWLVADSERQRYVAANPSGERVALSLETPRTRIECESFGFGRLELDERAGTLTFETVDGPVWFALRGERPRVLVNGTDVSDRLATDARGRWRLDAGS